MNGMATASTRMTLDEFLALPETEPPSELIDGEVVQKTMPTYLHSLIASYVAAVLLPYLMRTREGTVHVEPRHAHRQESRSYLPDVAVILRGRVRSSQEQQRGPLWFVPDIAVEVLSPDDRPGHVAEKVDFYIRSGTPLVWLIDPIDRTLIAYRPARPATHHVAPEVIGAAPVLRDFRLDLQELFALADEALEDA